MALNQDLRTPKQVVAETPSITLPKLRWWIFHAASNGLAAAIVKIRGRIYIDIVAFNEWLEGQRLGPANQT